MRVMDAQIHGVRLLRPDVHRDRRGFFVETFRKDVLNRAGISAEFVQGDHSRSVTGTLRGLHFEAPPGQGKVIRVARGRIYEAIVDIRRRSPTFGAHTTFVLDDEVHEQLYIPPGIAHGFAVLSDLADVCYLVSGYYDAALERGIAWDDPDLGIAWPVDDPVLSERDKHHPRLRDLGPELTVW